MIVLFILTVFEASFVLNNAVTISSSFALASITVYQAGFFGMAWAALVAGGVWLFAKVRGALVGFFLDSDEDDDLGIRKLLSWAEDGWVGIGTFLLVLLPILALVVSGLTLLVLFLVQRYFKAREEKQKVPGAACGKPNYPSAIECFSCRHATVSPVKLGFLGQPAKIPVTNLDDHRLDLLSRKRCFACASRLPRKAIRQNCEACGSEVFPSKEWVERYLEHVKSKLPRTLLVSFGLSLVPLFGLIPGIVYYRVSLISNLRRYIPRSTGCLLRLVNMVLLALQWVPLLGAVTLPLMCLVNYHIYLRSLENDKLAAFLPRLESHPLAPPAGQASAPLGS